MDKVHDITTSLVKATEDDCECNFGQLHISDAAVSCIRDTNKVLYRAKLTATPSANSTVLLLSIARWIKGDQPTIVSQGLRLSVEDGCPLEIQSFRDEECVAGVAT